jgi:hypothetical protein
MAASPAVLQRCPRLVRATGAVARVRDRPQVYDQLPYEASQHKIGLRMTYHETIDLLEGVGSCRHHLWAELGLPVPMAMTVRVVLVDWAKYVRYPCCLMT